jgi:hypothetical protein
LKLQSFPNLIAVTKATVAQDADMKRRIGIIAVSTVLSAIMVVATMQMVCLLLNAMFPHHPKHYVIWLVK